MSADDVSPNLGISRRQLIKRSAVVGGTVVWAAPVIQSLTSPASAASPVCNCISVCVTLTLPTVPPIVLGHITCDLSPATCACVCCCAGITSSCGGCASPTPCAVVPVLLNCTGVSAGPC